MIVETIEIIPFSRTDGEIGALRENMKFKDERCRFIMAINMSAVARFGENDRRCAIPTGVVFLLFMDC